MFAGIKEVLTISTPENLSHIERLLGTGQGVGLKISYKIQPKSDGLTQAFIIGKDFIGEDNVCFILGANFFFAYGLVTRLEEAKKTTKEGRATIFGSYVNDPERYGVAGFDTERNATSIEEKPEIQAFNLAVVGL